jgi:DNA-binding GntR family transcriptional regulator
MYQARVTEEALNEHASILAALEKKDGPAAEFAMRDHIARSRERLLQAFEE